MPEGLLSQKFKTHVNEPGVSPTIDHEYLRHNPWYQVLYWSPEGDPIWFTVGKGSNALIPTGDLNS